MTEENQDNPEVEDSQKVMNQRHANRPTLAKLWSSVILSKDRSARLLVMTLNCSDSVIAIITEETRSYWISNPASTTGATTSAFTFQLIQCQKQQS